MLYRHKQGTFEVCPYKATYLVKRPSTIEDGTETIELEDGSTQEVTKYKPILVDVEETRFVHDKEYFENILNNHEQYSNLVYEDVVLTDEQKQRYEQIRFLPESSIGSCIDYITDGVFPEGNKHPLRHLQLETENKQLGQALSEREINEIMQGIQLSDLEIQILELKLGGN